MTRDQESGNLLTKKSLGVLTTISLVISALAGASLPATATTASNPTIVFSGNTLASSLPPTETATRIGDTLALTTASLSRTTTTTRTGYSFGGWSLAVGEAATNTITTTTTSDTTRTIHAVWNTTITYNLNGADSGLPTGGLTSATYRFGQTLTLPTGGTMVKSGFAFGGWMSSSLGTTRSTTYTAASDAVGNPTLYAAWIKTVSFNANGATVGTIPAALTYISGGTRLVLPTISSMTLRRPGYEFVGWSTSQTGQPVSNPTSYVPVVSQRTLYAIWKISTTKATTRVFFVNAKSGLRASQKLILRELADQLEGKTNIKISITATRAPGSGFALGKARNKAVIDYLKSLGIEAVYERKNVIGKGVLASSKKNNRATLVVTWLNPTS